MKECLAAINYSGTPCTVFKQKMQPQFATAIYARTNILNLDSMFLAEKEREREREREMEREMEMETEREREGGMNMMQYSQQFTQSF